MRADGLPGVQDGHIRRKAGQYLHMHSLIHKYGTLHHSSCSSCLCQAGIECHTAVCSPSVRHPANFLCRPAPHTHSSCCPAGIDVASIKNKGVEAREARDRELALKSGGSSRERLAESSAALERKAALYERLAAQGGTGDDGQDEQYEVSGIRTCAEKLF